MIHDTQFHAALQTKIQDLLSDKFSDVEIVSVEIADEFDGFEDGVEITVTFRGTSEQLVKGRPPGMFEMVRAKLSDISATAFPVFNFISIDARA